MAEADWTFLTGSLSSAEVARGVTAGITPPNGGGNFVYGFHSLDVTPGAVGLFVNLTNFAPMSKGGSIRGALRRGLSGGPLNFSPMLFIGLGGSATTSSGYLLGLMDGNPSRIVLRKGSIDGGIPDAAVGASGVLRRSVDAVAVDEWVHLRLDMIANLNGDVRLQVYRNDLAAHPIGTSPSWEAVAGMAEFVDDALQVNSGSAPYTSGRAGFAFRTADVTRRAYVDQLECYRQL